MARDAFYSSNVEFVGKCYSYVFIPCDMSPEYIRFVFLDVPCKATGVI